MESIMKQIFISFFLTFFLISSVYSADYSEMSTQELIAIMGHIKKENQQKFQNELKKRIPQMSLKEKQDYEKNLEKLTQK